MDSMWEYNAPQFVDFTKQTEDDHADEYFDVDHEINGMSESFTDVTIIKLLEDPIADENQPKIGDVILTTQDSSERKSGEPARKISNVSMSQHDTDASTYEDALAELSATKTPVLPVRSCTTSLRHSARKNDVTPADVPVKTEEILPNVCTSLSKWRNASKTARHSSGKVEQNSKPKSHQPSVVSVQQEARNSSSHQTLDVKRGITGTVACGSGGGHNLRSRTCSLDRLNTPENTKERKMKELRGTSVNAATSCENLTSSKTRGRSEDREMSNRKSPSLRSISGIKNQPAAKLTIPHTPQFLKREMKFLHAVPVKSSEQQEIEKIRAMRRALADKRRLAEESRVKALAATGYTAAMRSAQPLTEPQEFQFATDDRIKMHSMETRQDAALCKETNFASELRNYSSVPVIHGKTIPQPFNLRTERKRKFSEGTESNGKFESVAEKVIKFCTQTPERFRRKSPAYHLSLEHLHADCNDRLTVPKTPNLQTRKRSRPTTVISQAEREEMEWEEAKRHQFQAKPVNHKIFESGPVGVKKVIPKECTVPMEIHFETEERLKLRKSHEPNESLETFEFHAQPLPKAILQGPVGVPPPKSIALTVPQSPAFATKNAMRFSSTREKDVQEVVEKPCLRVRPVPHIGIPFQPRLEHHTTEPLPFSFVERDKELFAKKDEKIKKVFDEEKKAREFHANPVRNLTPVLPPKKPIPITEPEPFEFEVDVRGAKKAEELRKQIEEDEHKLKKMAAFKAKPPIVLLNKPFVPQRSNKPLTEILDLQLNTERRAETRLEYEKWRHEKESEEAMERCLRERQRQIDELNEMKRLRAEAVHKANPIRNYKPVEVVPSSQPLTQPVSPRFSERLRSRNVVE